MYLICIQVYVVVRKKWNERLQDRMWVYIEHCNEYIRFSIYRQETDWLQQESIQINYLISSFVHIAVYLIAELFHARAWTNGTSRCNDIIIQWISIEQEIEDIRRLSPRVQEHFFLFCLFPFLKTIRTKNNKYLTVQKIQWLWWPFFRLLFSIARFYGMRFNNNDICLANEINGQNKSSIKYAQSENYWSWLWATYNVLFSWK